MPIYEYVCQECGQSCEHLEKVGQSPKIDCPHCHAAKLHRVVSAAGFQLKGDGWYVTDFRDKKGPPNSGNSESS